MAKRIQISLISFSIVVAIAGLVAGREPSVELFQPDPPVFSAGEEAQSQEPPEPEPSGKRLVLVNTRTHQLFMTLGGRVIFQARCATGKGTALAIGDETRVFDTPKGEFLVQSKEEHPTPQRRFDRTLGAYRINFGGGFGIHGTDEPAKIGQSVTHGCIRLSDADIRTLYPLVEVGDEVVIF